ncbi:RHS repeat protein [Paenibacillus assamensis]|uniref:RHS repeat protein n=1 Tax=Paenibacillus assamensis TaxID=311244 RepID=UPI0004066C23|nr:RHS repeat protein [Paenibacillus assamensis]
MVQRIRKIAVIAFIMSFVWTSLSFHGAADATASKARMNSIAVSNAQYEVEAFEGGSFSTTIYKAGEGLVTNDPSKVIAGDHSAHVESAPTQQWKDLMYSDASKMKFEKHTTYSVTFSYKSVKAPVKEQNGYFYFTARGVGSDYTSDKGWMEWNDQTGKTGKKTIVFKTGDKDNYFLIWGIHNGGALSIDDVKIEKISESFERGDITTTKFQAASGAITSEPGKVVTGKYAAYVESTPTQQWKDLMYSDAAKMKFEKHTTYSVTFSYKSVKSPVKEQDGYFYFTARGVGSDYTSDKGWTEWNDQVGKIGKKTIVFTTGDKDNYFLIWGIHNGGALSIDDVKIEKVSESFEQGSFTNTKFQPASGTVTSDPTKVVKGKYSAYVESDPTQQWRDLMYSDASKVKFEKHTTYSVTFSYKSVKAPVKEQNGYFYFTARGVGADGTSDRGWTEWNEPTGSTGKKTIVFKTGDQDNYFLIWGIHNGGAITLDNITIKEMDYQYDDAGKLIKHTQPSGSKITYHYDSNGNLVRTSVHN